ncbi:hypothetical protein C8R45DRAFT_1023444 [Mycena sanguinolenta]|nr:hypothetical protein C8R45DRAFT_1023444 [Mycena sanguinolenta]
MSAHSHTQSSNRASERHHGRIRHGNGPVVDVHQTSLLFGGLPSPQSVSSVWFRPPVLQHPPPPLAPRIRTIPLPSVEVGPVPQPLAETHRESFPIDLKIDLDLEHLERAVGNHIIPARSTIHIVPTARDRPLIQISLGEVPTTAILFIRRLCSVMRAPLSLQYYQSELSADIQDTIFRYFLSCRGPNGRRLWRDFLDGHHHPYGPTGEVLLQGHFFLWGIWEDAHSRWFVDVDIQRSPVTHAPLIHYGY